MSLTIKNFIVKRYKKTNTYNKMNEVSALPFLVSCLRKEKKNLTEIFYASQKHNYFLCY